MDDGRCWVDADLLVKALLHPEVVDKEAGHVGRGGYVGRARAVGYDDERRIYAEFRRWTREGIEVAGDRAVVLAQMRFEYRCLFRVEAEEVEGLVAEYAFLRPQDGGRVAQAVADSRTRL